MSTAAKPRRPYGFGAFLLRMGLVALAGLLAGVANNVFGAVAGWPGLLLTLLSNTAAMVVGYVVCVRWWRGIDEAAREAHKSAWWWGGCAGMAFGGVLMLTALARPAEMNFDALSLNEVFSAGVWIVLLCQLIGYGVAWSTWWLKRR